MLIWKIICLILDIFGMSDGRLWPMLIVETIVVGGVIAVAFYFVYVHLLGGSVSIKVATIMGAGYKAISWVGRQIGNFIKFLAKVISDVFWFTHDKLEKLGAPPFLATFVACLVAGLVLIIL